LSVVECFETVFGVIERRLWAPYKPHPVNGIVPPLSPDPAALTLLKD
jgi:hypothetical protein